jgi:hypothetical protein
MNVSLEYLLSFLEDEFASFPEARVRLLPKAGTQRSVDLPQDYDPEANDLHKQSGVIVKIGSREHFFPEEWASPRNFEQVRALAAKIRERLE